MEKQLLNQQLILDFLYYKRYISQEEFNIGLKIRNYYLEQKDDFQLGMIYNTVKTEGGKDYVNFSELFENHRNWYKIKSILKTDSDFIENTICSNLTIRDLKKRYFEQYYIILYKICKILEDLVQKNLL